MHLESNVKCSGCEMLCSSASTLIFRSMPMPPTFHFRYQNEHEEIFFRWASQNIQYQILAAANKSSKRLIPYGSGIECMWNSCLKHSVRHNACLGILWPYRRFEFSNSFNALNSSTGSHNRTGYLLAFAQPMLDSGIPSHESEVLWLPCHVRKKGWHQ